MDIDESARAAAVVASARELADAAADGRLPLGESVGWDIFPFEGDLRVRALEDPRLPEPPRSGADGIGCAACSFDDADALWTDGRWRVRSMEQPQALLTVFLEPIEHVDLSELAEGAAAEFGRMVVRVTRALESLPGVGRVHVNRWGDGAEHLHIWFFVRPAGLLQLRGSTLADWFDLLPPMSQESWDADLEALRVRLEPTR